MAVTVGAGPAPSDAVGAGSSEPSQKRSDTGSRASRPPAISVSISLATAATVWRVSGRRAKEKRSIAWKYMTAPAAEAVTSGGSSAPEVEGYPPQTSAATDTISSSLRRSSSIVRRLPSSVEEKPHCPDRHSWSMST